MIRNSIIFLACFFMISRGYSQESTRPHWYFEGGIKKSVFEIVYKDVLVLLPDDDYTDADNEPIIKNTYSFYTQVKGMKNISRKWVMSGTAGVDMQQLDMVTGLKFEGSTDPPPAFTIYSRHRIKQLIPRLKADWGLHYQMNLGESTRALAGISAGQMIKLSGKGFSYSFVQPSILLKRKQWFLSVNASFSPFNVQIPHMENYFGDFGAQSVKGAYEFRIYEMGIGLGVKL